MDVASLVIKRFFFQRIFLSMRLAENMKYIVTSVKRDPNKLEVPVNNLADQKAIAWNKVQNQKGISTR